MHTTVNGLVNGSATSLGINEEDRIDLEGFRSKVDIVLADFFAERVRRLPWVAGDTNELVEKILRFVMSGGKRVRPTMCWLGWLGAGGQDIPAIVAAAASLELFHAFALIHDDIMDRSTSRRNQLTVHHQFTEWHEREKWRGDSGSFGTSMGILAGDLSLILSEVLLHESGLPARSREAAKPILHEMWVEITAGQYLDVLEQARRTYSIDDAITVIRYKTARYTIERPLRIGAALAGADPALSRAYTAFGIPLGEAFQLRDDVLGMFGDPAVTGKPNVDDLREGKQTVLIALARERATTRQRELIDRLHGAPLLDPEQAAELRAIAVDTGALAEVETMIADRRDSAVQALADAPITPRVQQCLRHLARAVTERTS